MAQVIETYCDGCLVDGQKVPAKTYRASVGVVGTKHPTYDIDLCDDHAKPLVVMLEAFEESGRVVGGKRGRPSKVLASPNQASSPSSVSRDLSRCPVDGCGYTGQGTKSALSSHLRSAHDTTIAAAFGEELPFACDVCGNRFAKAQAVAAHRARSHSDSPKVSVEELRVGA